MRAEFVTSKTDGNARKHIDSDILKYAVVVSERQRTLADENFLGGIVQCQHITREEDAPNTPRRGFWPARPGVWGKGITEGPRRTAPPTLSSSRRATPDG